MKNLKNKFIGTIQLFLRKIFRFLAILNSGDGKKNYLEYEKKIVKMLDKHALNKTKIFRGNHKPQINKTLSKAL